MAGWVPSMKVEFLREKIQKKKKNHRGFYGLTTKRTEVYHSLQGMGPARKCVAAIAACDGLIANQRRQAGEQVPAEAFFFFFFLSMDPLLNIDCLWTAGRES